jgi:hypothetical protein
MIDPWPGSSSHYFETTSEPKFEDWRYSYWGFKDKSAVKTPDSGMWEYLGNGYTLLKAGDQNTDRKAWYLA